MTPSAFTIVIKQGTKSGSDQPKSGGNGQAATRVFAQLYSPSPEVINPGAATNIPTVYFTIEGIEPELSTSSNPLLAEVQQFPFPANTTPLNDYTLIANLSEPASQSQDVTLVGGVEYAS